MKKFLFLQCALVIFVTACSSNRTVSRPTRDANIMAYVWENGRPEHASVDWNSPWRADQYAQGGTSAARGTVISRGEGGLETRDQADIELRKEELVVGKKEVSNGGVLVRKVVQTENVNHPLELRREEYVIERIPSSDSASRGTDYTFQGQEIYIPLKREEPVTSKRVVLTERVHVGKKTEMDRQTITKPVRTEEVEIVKNPNLSDSRFSSVPRQPAPSYNRDLASRRDESAKGGTSPSDRSGVGTLSESGTRDAADLELAREEFTVGKRDVDNGGVLLKKVVRTQEASQPIELKREEFVIDRNPIRDQQVDSADFREREIRINLTREESVVGTRNFVTETVRLRKKIETDRETIAATLRRENLEIIKNPGQTASRMERDETAQGGTGIATQSGVSSTSESSASSSRRGKSDRENGKDQAISERVRAALANGTVSTSDTASRDNSNIQVSTRNSVVTLKGSVNSESEKRSICERVEGISGVRSVKNELQVSKASE